MKTVILLLVISTAVASSCSTAYKSGQTPDDVYFSPARVIEEDTKKEEDKEQARTETAEQREITMKVRDRRWRDLDNDYDCNCSCNYHPYKYGYSYGYYYNPYYYPYPVYSGVTYVNPKISPVRMTNLAGYNQTSTIPVVNSKTGKTEYIPRTRTYNNSNTTRTREVYTPSTNNTRTYSPSTSGSTNSSGSGRSVSRPARKN